MSEAALATGQSPAPKGLVARFLGTVFSPRETFENVARYPRWLGMLAVLTVAGMIGGSALMMTEKGRELALDAQVSTMESFGMQVSDRMYDQMRERLERTGPIFAGIGPLVSTPLMTLIVAGIGFVVFKILGGDATFKQNFAVTVHAWIIPGVVSQAFNLPLAYMRGALSGASNLGALLPFLDEKSLLAHFLGAIDLFWVWWMVVISIGFAVLYRRRTQPIAITLFAIYGVIALIIALIKSRLGG